MDKFCSRCKKDTEHSVFTTDNRATYICTICGYVEDIFVSETLQQEWSAQQQPNLPKCPKCGSTAISTGARGFNLMSGMLGASKTVNRCANCGHTWKPNGK